MEQWWKNLKFKRQQWWRQKAKSTNKCFIKSKLKLKDYKNCLEAAQIENKIFHLEKNKIDLDSPKEFTKNIRLIL